MRTTFIKQLMARTTKNTFLMVGDVGYSVVEPFEEKYPNQYLNAGVAEQNMTGMAAGLALEGYKVITYSIANFNTIRPLEQIRNDICYHNLDVTIASVGGGFVYGSAGYSHHAVQDIAMLGSLPNMTLLLPADAKETAFCMDYIFDTTGPKYIRLGRNGEKSLHSEKSIISKINAVSVTKGATIAVVAVGTIASVALELQELLLKKNCIVNIYTCPVIDTDFKKGITKTLKNMEYIFTLEEHVVDFGFGSLVKNAFEGAKQKIYSFGVDRDMCKVVGSQTYLRNEHGLSAAHVSKKVIAILKK